MARSIEKHISISVNDMAAKREKKAAAARKRRKYRRAAAGMATRKGEGGKIIKEKSISGIEQRCAERISVAALAAAPLSKQRNQAATERFVA